MSTQDPKNDQAPSNDAGADVEASEVLAPPAAGPVLPPPVVEPSAAEEPVAPSAETAGPPDTEPVVEDPATEKFDLIEPDIQETAALHDPTTQVLITPTAEDIAKASASQGYIDQDADPNAGSGWVATGDPAIGYEGMDQNAVTHYPETQPMMYSSEEQQMLAPSTPYYPTAPPPIAMMPEKKFGNLGFSLSMAFIGTIVFAGLLFVVYWLLLGSGLMPYFGEIETISLLTYPTYYFAVLAFLVGYLIIGLVGSKLGWWFHVIAGYLVGALVAVAILFARMYEESVWAGQSLAWDPVVALQASLVVAIAFILAREVPVWMGAIVGSRALKQRQRKEQSLKDAELHQEELAARYAADQGAAQQNGGQYAGQYQQNQQGYQQYQQPPYPPQR